MTRTAPTKEDLRKLVLGFDAKTIAVLVGMITTNYAKYVYLSKEIIRNEFKVKVPEDVIDRMVTDVGDIIREMYCDDDNENPIEDELETIVLYLRKEYNSHTRIVIDSQGRKLVEDIES
jgi:hypothetical protein